MKTFTDPRDGKKYKIVKIGNQTWMAENLNYECEGSKPSNEYPGYKCYGLFYDWETAKKACPPGWHLPSDSEWIALINAIDGSQLNDSQLDCSKISEAGSSSTVRKLKATSGWIYNEKSVNGTDDFGFSALPSYIMDNIHDDRFSVADWWSASELSSGMAWNWGISSCWEDSGVRHGFSNKSGVFRSVRCVQDSGGGCYIATCVYGSYDCPEVLILRQFRDNELSNSWFGRQFIRIYYAISPKIVELFGSKKWFTKLWRPIIDKIVCKLQNN